MEYVDWNDFLKDVISLIKHTVPKYVVKINLGESVRVKIDKMRVEQVLANIIGNAAKYSNPECDIELSSTFENSLITVSVKDKGIGMREKDKLRIFEKFHRNPDVKQHYSGLGMGLYISSKIVKSHGGDIWVDSEVGKGSTFYFSLPVENPAEMSPIL